MIKMIACVSQNSVLGSNGKLALSYPEDMKHFRKMTAGATVIMGRKTFQEINKPLPKRQNIVVSRFDLNIEGVENYSSLKEAIDKSTNENVWLCGGASIYEEGMQFAGQILLTIAPDILNDKTANYVKFPWINPGLFVLSNMEKFEGDSPLFLATYDRV